MKKYIFAIIAALFIISCENTNENLVQQRGAAVVPKMSEVLPAFFTENINASFVEFDVSLSPGESVEKAEIEVVRTRGNKSAILKSITLPATKLKITATEILTALSIPANDFVAGDNFNLYVLTTKNGKTTRSIAAVGIPVVCYFDVSMLTGNYYYVSTSWGDEGDVVLEADPGDPYKIYVSGIAETMGLTGNGNRLELNLNPNNFRVTGPRVVIASSAWGYTNFAMAPSSGRFDSCANAFIVTFAITVDQGSFGSFSFTFTKQ